MEAQKKPYTPPTLTNFGNVVDKTKGFGGESYENYMPKPWIWEDIKPTR